MKYLVISFFLLSTVTFFAQTKESLYKISGTIVNDNNGVPIGNVNIINLNQVIGTVSDSKGNFEINAKVNDTLHISFIGFQAINVRVTNDWVNTKSTKISLTEKAFALEEVVIDTRYQLTGRLEVDAKRIPIKDNYRFSISGLPTGYEAGEYSPGVFNKVLNSIFNPADFLYNVFSKKTDELKKLKQMKKDDTVRNLLQSKFDRETLAVLLGVTKNDVNDILQHCNYSEVFIQTANDLQVMDAISECYEDYKVLKRN